jgi:hypothetical protein
MKKFDIGQALSILANVGVIAGLVFLGFELNQNNELMEAEVRTTYASMDQNGWGYLIENPDFIEVLIKDRSGEELTEAEELRLNALWMQNLAQHQFRYLEDPDSAVNWVLGQRRNFESYRSLRSAWQGTGSSRQAGKDNFDNRFVQFYDENVANPR